MELKDYQTRVLRDLADYLDVLDRTPNLAQAFADYWVGKGVRMGSAGGRQGMEPYKNTVPGVPHICAKVPTAGGKTFIAVNALDTIFSALSKRSPMRPKMVVWLVPSLTILDQTVQALNNPAHPYRKRLDQLFRHRVAVYEKRDLLMGAGFSYDTAQGQLSIVVMSFDSLRAKNKEDRKIFQENGNLASFLLPDNGDSGDCLLPEHDASALINVIRRLRPVVVVDESHNAESLLSVEMMKNLNPDFILDLTATPRNNSNIISFVDALALKNQHMVKLPVIVANRSSKTEVMESALILRGQLEAMADKEAAAGGKRIRPIVLFQAQPRTADDNTTFEKIRDKLIEWKVPAEQIKIKTADINELKGVDLMGRDCPVRYIITVNALKEGWDCPNAYILASLADKTSAVDVEQILGRVLRMPHVQQHSHDLLNLSYVFTASNRFMDTLQSVVKGLNRAGFTDKDFRAVEEESPTPVPDNATPAKTLNLFDAVPAATGREEDGLDLGAPAPDWQTAAQLPEAGEAAMEPAAVAVSPAASFVEQIKAQAQAENEAFEAKAQAAEEGVTPELEDKMNRHRLKDVFREDATNLALPQFFIKVQNGGFFDTNQPFQLFEKEELLKEFRLSQADAAINFDDVETELYRVDLEQLGDENYAPKAFKLAVNERARFTAYLLSLPQESQIANLVTRLTELIGNMYPISDPEVKAYVRRIVSDMSADQVRDCIERDVAYVRKIKKKISTLADVHALKTFVDLLDMDRIVIQPGFQLPESITPSANASSVPKSIYTTEAAMGDFERRLINDIANLESVKWWHRNLSRGKGFRINGFLNHYPDFIVKTKAGKIIALETKGDDRDNSDSELKLKLGKLWESKAGRDYRYMMVFENNPIDGAERLTDALKKIAQL
ncbi:MAG: DEAD/DEAH box helicase family protein [Hydrogenophaga sp.]|uniref:DEAD/DEAH box helicase n=1 Tax=Hydrogenophaga sp. TaxID=1904254 RepID=UPI002769EBF5|nr:DEAD/DEAH box helicase family protein [Hydrogenophaga sp.]MDP2416479.1 DEAD/DEAH box helicase family protein [Hydrogenophaga sp.]MDZ4186496.1 DEAD/DEAH box helicase family protein [Hydrogenophaga sp.]